MNLNEINVDFLDDLSLWSAPFGIALLDKVIYKKNIKVLDVGSGTGFPLLELAQRLGAESRVIGIDLWDNAIKKIKSKAKYLGLNNVEIHKVDAEELPFESNYFDLIVSNNGLNNVAEQLNAFRECCRTLKTGGQFVFTFNLPESMIEFYNIYEKLLADFEFFAEIQKMKEHIRIKRKTIIETNEILCLVGLKIKDITQSSFNLKFADATSMFSHNFIKVAFADSWKEIVSAHDINQIFNELEKRLNEYSADNSGLCLQIPFACYDCTK